MTNTKRRTAAWTSIAALAAVAGSGAASLAHAQEGGDAVDGTVAINDLLWRVGSNTENVPWNDAHRYCETLEHAGFDDWRLPTLAELEALHDPAAESGLTPQLGLDDCCAWSSTSLADMPAEAKGQLPEPTNDPAGYFWGFLFASGDRYYSFQSFSDGVAMCVREP